MELQQRRALGVFLGLGDVGFRGLGLIDFLMESGLRRLRGCF